MIALGVATHFSQGWPRALIGEAVALGAAVARDDVWWEMIETAPGRYDFGDPRIDYADAARAAGLPLSFLFHPDNALYDAGKTVHSAGAIDAFAAFIVATLDRFPAVGRIEIGNEFNAFNFVSGPVLEAGYGARAQNYTKILEAVALAVRAAHPDVEIVGGAMHSVPVGYAAALGAAGAFEFMDAVAIHPYTSAPEDLADQLALLRTVTGDLPIHVTEFGSDFSGRAEAPAYLVKMTAVMAAAEVAEAQWYALYEEPWFPNMELIDKAGRRTPAGDSFAFVEENLLGAATAERLATAASTYAYAFGDDALVLWGEGQRVAFAPSIRLYDASGAPLSDFDGVLDPDAPIIALGPVEEGRTFAFGASALLAHSLHDFDLIAPEGDRAGYEGPWSYFEERGDGLVTRLYTMPGGEVSHESWTPYIGHQWRRPLAVTSTSVNPVDFSGTGQPTASYAVLERMTVARDDVVTVSAHWDVNDASADGVAVAIRLNGETLFERVLFDRANGHVLDAVLPGIRVAAGDRIDFVVGPNGNARGNDITARSYEVVSELTLPTIFAADGTTVVGTRAGERLDASLCRTAVALDGEGGDDVVVGGAGADAIGGGAGADTLIGGAGADMLTIDALDRIVAGAEDGRGGDGDGDGGGQDTVRVMGRAPVALDVAAANAGRVAGGRGADVLDGADATWTLRLSGGRGDDTLAGGAGDDRLHGGRGADVFVFGEDPGHDRVRGFGAGDTLSLSRELAPDLAAVEAAARVVGRSLVLEFDGGSIVLQRLSDPSALTAETVLFL